MEDDFNLLPARLADAGIAVLPRQECDGISQKLLNYMAAGKPTVAFAGSAKVLLHEETGLIAANGDIPGFAAAIGRLVDEPALRVRLGTAARAYVMQHHSWAAAAELAEGLYEPLLRRTDRSPATLARRSNRYEHTARGPRWPLHRRPPDRGTA